MLDFEDTKKSCGIWPCSALKLKMLTQGIRVPLMHIFTFALITKISS